MAETVLSTRGQVVIPAYVRRKLGLEPSARLRVSVHDGAIVLTPVPAQAAPDAWLQAWDQECARRPSAGPALLARPARRGARRAEPWELTATRSTPGCS